MATLENVLLAEKLAADAGVAREDDKSVAFRIATTDTDATTNKIVVGTAGTQITHTYNATATTYDLGGATYDTAGEFVDVINNTAAFYSAACLVDAKYDDTLDNSLLAGTYEYCADAVATAKDVYWDTDGTSCKHHTAAQQHATVTAAGVLSDDTGYISKIYEIVALTSDTTGTATLNVYREGVDDTAGTLIYTRTHATGGAEVSYSFGDQGLGGEVGDRIIAQLVQQTPSGHIAIRGKSFRVR